ARKREGLLDRRLRQRLSEEHHGRLEKSSIADPATRRHLDGQASLDLAAGFTIPTVEALDGAAGSVNFDHRPAARVLVQAIGVLCDDGDDATAGFEGGQRVMA